MLKSIKFNKNPLKHIMLKVDGLRIHTFKKEIPVVKDVKTIVV